MNYTDIHQSQNRTVITEFDRKASYWASRAAKKFARIIYKSDIDFSEIYMAIWATGWGFITTFIIHDSMYSISPYYQILRNIADRLFWGIPIFLLGIFHIASALSYNHVARRYAAGFAMVWWAALAAVFLQSGWPVVSFSYQLAALSSIWCYARLSIDHEVNGHLKDSGSGH